MTNRLVHTAAHHWPETDDAQEGFLCVCGEIFVQDGSNNNWDPGIIQFSAHLKKMNVPVDEVDIYIEAQKIMDTYRGSNEPRPEKPAGDDPRSGHPIVTPNGWRRWFGLK